MSCCSFRYVMHSSSQFETALSSSYSDTNVIGLSVSFPPCSCATADPVAVGLTLWLNKVLDEVKKILSLDLGLKPFDGASRFLIKHVKSRFERLLILFNPFENSPRSWLLLMTSWNCFLTHLQRTRWWRSRYMKMNRRTSKVTLELWKEFSWNRGFQWVSQNDGIGRKKEIETQNQRKRKVSNLNVAQSLIQHVNQAMDYLLLIVWTLRILIWLSNLRFKCSVVCDCLIAGDGVKEKKEKKRDDSLSAVKWELIQHPAWGQPCFTYMKWAPHELHSWLMKGLES